MGKIIPKLKFKLQKLLPSVENIAAQNVCNSLRFNMKLMKLPMETRGEIFDGFIKKLRDDPHDPKGSNKLANAFEQHREHVLNFR